MAPESEPTPLRLMIFDRTCRGRSILPGLSHAWSCGGWLYRGLGRVDACKGVSKWTEALEWIADHAPERKIAEIQFWGHGKWGAAKIGSASFGVHCLLRDHELKAPLDKIAARMLPAEKGLIWFRTCETFGAAPGHAFAAAISDRLGCRAAGHTYIIGPLQSGLHSILPGATPHWADDEALTAGTPACPERAAWSSFRAPNTITFMHGRIPTGY